MDGLFENELTIEVYTSTIARGVCSSDVCSAAVTWATVVKSGANMIFTGQPEPVRTGEHQGTPTTFFRHEDNHWKDCPDAERFKKRGAR